MKNKIASVILMVLFLSASNVFATKKDNKSSNPPANSSISGIIVDKSSNEKLAGVMIHIIDTDQKIYSDTKGEFSLTGITPGTYTVKINCISYKDKELTLKVSGAQEEKVKIQLNPIEP